MREAVAVGPVGALGTFLSLRVVDAFLVRTADNAVGHYHRAGAVLADEGQHRDIDARLETDVAPFREPAAYGIGLGALSVNDGHGHLAGAVCVRSIQCDRGNRIATKSSLRKLVQARGLPLDSSHGDNETSSGVQSQSLARFSNSSPAWGFCFVVTNPRQRSFRCRVVPSLKGLGI